MDGAWGIPGACGADGACGEDGACGAPGACGADGACGMLGARGGFGGAYVYDLPTTWWPAIIRVPRSFTLVGAVGGVKDGAPPVGAVGMLGAGVEGIICASCLT